MREDKRCTTIRSIPYGYPPVSVLCYFARARGHDKSKAAFAELGVDRRELSDTFKRAPINSNPISL